MPNPEQWQVSKEAAEAYERYPARYVLGPWAPVLVESVRLVPGDCVLDVACGTGVVTRLAAERVGPRGRVIGIDLNPGMIAVARSLPSPAGTSIEWIERSALDLGLGDQSIDVVLCQQGLQFFPDKPLALAEMRRVLRRGGRLGIAVWNNTGHYNTALGNALARLVGDDVSARFCASRRAPSGDELQRLAAEAGFVDIDLRIATLDIRLPRLDGFALDHLGATPIAPVIAGLGSETRTAIGLDVMQQMDHFRDGDGVSYPEETYILTAVNRG